jgi:hypothetical protein
LSESPPRLTTLAKVLLGVLVLAAAGFGGALAAGFVKGLPVTVVVASYAVAAVAGTVLVLRSRRRMVRRELDGLHDLTLGDEGIRLPAGPMSTRLVPWAEIADVTARRSARFGDGYIRDAIWVELVTGAAVESSIQCFVPRSRLKQQPSGARQFEQTAILAPALFDAVISRLRRELRNRHLHANTRGAPRQRRH